MTILPNELFDDGSIEARNFTVVLYNELYETAEYYEWSGIQKHYPEYVKEILEAFKAGKHHYTVDIKLPDEFSGLIVEFQWD
jgi:hypothetical protein